MRPPSLRLALAYSSLAATLLASLCACGSGGGRRDLQSRYPLDRARAIVDAAERGDAESVHQLVTLLEDDDGAIRMYAILALERLSGQTYGYRYHDPEPARAEAVRRWRDALRAGKVTIRNGSQSAMPRDDGLIASQTEPAAGAAGGPPPQ